MTATGPLISESTAWHSKTLEEVLSRLETVREGLRQREVEQRLQRFGKNELPREAAVTLWVILLRQFKSPLIYILLIAALVALLVGDFTDAGFVGIVLAVNALIGGWQEWRAEKSSRALQDLMQVRASVVRDGHTRVIPAQEVVPGDVVWVESGDRVPADMRLMSTHSLEIDESLLTGESLAVTKDSAWVGNSESPVGDRSNMAFAGTIVNRGRGVGVVVETGAHTLVGQLAIDVMNSGGARPPLMERMDHFSRVVAVVILFAAIGIGSLGVVVHNYSVLQMVMFGIALAVAAIPEGLPITITVALANATSRMAARGVIVRRLAAVEGLGSCTLIASDKTGTLTVNELTVQQIYLPSGKTLEVTGEGFAPEGNLLHDRQIISVTDDHQKNLPSQRLQDGGLEELPELLKIAVLCNEGSLHRQDNTWFWRGDPTDIALLAMAEKAGLERERLLAEHPQVNQIPFEPEYQFSASHHRHGNQIRVYVKGSPERTLAMCDFEASADMNRMLEEASRMANAGFRVLALASGDVIQELNEADPPPQPSQLRLAGFVGMIDPLRAGVREAVAACKQAGIKVCMVTGDHPVTAKAIAKNLGLDQEGGLVVQGHELANKSSDELQLLVQRSNIFARVAPRQKLEIVNAARASGHFVAVTGDGVNDAPALRAANIGVAMGKSGTDVARESAELIISDDNFATIVAGVEEGRIAYDNIRKVIFLLISTGAAEVSLLGLAIISGAPLPLLPVQILWLNLVTSGIQDKPLAFEAAEDDVLRRPPRSPKESIFDSLMIERTLVVAFVMAALGYSSFIWMLKQGWDEDQARNGLLLFLVLMKTFHLGATRSETKYTFFLSPLKSPLLVACGIGAVVVHLLAMFVPWLQKILKTQPVTLETFLFFAAVATLVFVAMELHKWSWNLRYGR